MAVHARIGRLPADSEPALGFPDAESRAWLTSLRSTGPERRTAVARLHQLLLDAARFELSRRSEALSHVGGDEADAMAAQAADDALTAVLAKLGDYRGASRFTTWAYKFVLLEAGVLRRRRAWRGRDLVFEPELWPEFEEIADCLTPQQRDVLLALTLSDVPIDVLAERLNTTRAALYETLQEGRRSLRARLAQRGGGD